MAGQGRLGHAHIDPAHGYRPLTGLEGDAARGNFKGVARCISAGVSVTELEGARFAFPHHAPHCRGKESGGELSQARRSRPTARRCAKSLST